MDVAEAVEKRTVLSKKLTALRALYETGDLAHEDYARQVVEIKRERRRLWKFIDRAGKGGLQNLPALIPRRTHEEREDEDGGNPNFQSEAHSDARDWSKYAVPERRCKAKSTNTGRQCKNVAILGGTVCRFHGGSSPQVKQAARVRLEMAADRMAANLLGLAEFSPNEQVKLGATNSALDRAGLKAPAEVVLSQGNRAYEEIFDDIGTMTRAESRAARGITDDSFEPVDGQQDWSANIVDYQSDSRTESDTATNGTNANPPSPGDERQRSHHSAATSGDAAYAGPDGPQSRERRSREQSHRPKREKSYHGPTVTGEAAIALANAANAAFADERGLPRGRGK